MRRSRASRTGSTLGRTSAVEHPTVRPWTARLLSPGRRGSTEIPPLAPQTLGGNHFRSAGNPSELKIELQAEPRNARRPVLHTPACEDRIISLSHKVDRWRHAPPAVTRTRRGRNSAGSAPRLWPLPLARSSRSASSAMVQATPAPSHDCFRNHLEARARAHRANGPCRPHVSI